MLHALLTAAAGADSAVRYKLWHSKFRLTMTAG